MEVRARLKNSPPSNERSRLDRSKAAAVRWAVARCFLLVLISTRDTGLVFGLCSGNSRIFPSPRGEKNERAPIKEPKPRGPRPKRRFVRGGVVASYGHRHRLSTPDDDELNRNPPTPCQ